MGKKHRTIVLSLLFGAVLTSAGVADEFKLGLSIQDEGRRSFYLALGAHYGAKDTAIQFAMRKGIADDEMPVVFFLSSRACVKPEVVVGLRLKGMSWTDITLHFGLGAGIYYIPFHEDPGPPYGKAWGHFKAKPKADWCKIVLADRDIVDFVNLRFMYEHHKLTPNDVVKLKAKGKSFIDLNMTIKDCKARKGGHKVQDKDRPKSEGPGPGKQSKGGKKGKKSP